MLKRTGLSRGHVWFLVREGRFPEPVHVTERVRAWREDEVSAWIAERLQAHEARLAARQPTEQHVAA
ncbi:helix-turn-helix transcriptional regulator [Candidatus Rariloculus sp.]|uniref:helix-turn-helix transcriptional regulator n=1 Tax=Candidatus Rariloculus sp. TaxID=3101265 RepID=UPI003D0D9243